MRQTKGIVVQSFMRPFLDFRVMVFPAKIYRYRREWWVKEGESVPHAIVSSTASSPATNNLLTAQGCTRLRRLARTYATELSFCFKPHMHAIAFRFQISVPKESWRRKLDLSALLGRTNDQCYRESTTVLAFSTFQAAVSWIDIGPFSHLWWMENEWLASCICHDAGSGLRFLKGTEPEV